MTRMLTVIALVVALASCETFNEAMSGLGEALGESRTSMAEAEVEMQLLSPLLQFQFVYILAFTTGGQAMATDSYAVGDGTVWEISGSDGDTAQVERALLARNADGSTWWRLHFASDDDAVLYEFLITADYDLLEVRYRDPDSGEVQSWIPEDEDGEEAATEAEVITEDDYAPYVVGTERIRVGAGSFRAQHVVIEDEASRSEWWIARGEVPGDVIKYHYENREDGETAEGELIDFGSGYEAELLVD